MAKKARSARGDVVDFDLLAIKQQLATKVVPVSVDQRRKFIDEKDGFKTRVEIPQVAPALPDALMMAVEAATVSAQAASVEQTPAPVPAQSAADTPVDAA
jgi:hypothetical protein